LMIMKLARGDTWVLVASKKLKKYPQSLNYKFKIYLISCFDHF